jgi:DNA-binding NarL/FixJ family response regulator
MIGATHTWAGSLPSAAFDALGVLPQDVGLTSTLGERLSEIASGLPYEEIASNHQISVNTVKTEAQHLLRALGVSCRHEIEDAFEAAMARAERGASREAILEFLKIRFE